MFVLSRVEQVNPSADSRWGNRDMVEVFIEKAGERECSPGEAWAGNWEPGAEDWAGS